ncbi:hypothetical protein KCP76_18960 [Salmonella enterica subsp. enterica serovar Weltevreden]|nr:hypothetical protein KCP76_18960 [Salmonella enterica subsp. enterica serovar Weltevreden]
MRAGGCHPSLKLPAATPSVPPDNAASCASSYVYAPRLTIFAPTQPYRGVAPALGQNIAVYATSPTAVITSRAWRATRSTHQRQNTAAPTRPVPDFKA